MQPFYCIWEGKYETKMKMTFMNPQEVPLWFTFLLFSPVLITIQTGDLLTTTPVSAKLCHAIVHFPVHYDRYIKEVKTHVFYSLSLNLK